MPIYKHNIISPWYPDDSDPSIIWMAETIKIPDASAKKIESVTISPPSDRNRIEIISKDTVKVDVVNGGRVVGYRQINDPGHYVTYSWWVTVNYSVNSPPSKPGSITYAQNGVLGGSDMVVQWGSSTDPDGNLAGYELEANIGGAGWNQVARTAPNTLSHTYKVIKGSASIQFRVRAFDAENLKSDYTTGQTSSVINNAGPIITPIANVGDLGSRNLEFTYTYQVEDPDGDNVRVEESLNGVIFKTQTNAPQRADIETRISETQIAGLPVNILNRITIKATDGLGNTTYKYVTFTRTNRSPVITAERYDLGQVLNSINHVVTVEDPDGDPVSVTWSFNGKVFGTASVVGRGIVTVGIPAADFMRMRPGMAHALRVEARDDKDGVNARNISFVRTVNRVHVLYRHNSTAVDTKPNHILVVPTWKIADGAYPIVLVSNNADDESPVWEDATTVVLAGTRYPFTNVVKTAANWKVGIQIKIEKGTSTQMSYLSGLGGAIE